MLTDGLPVGRPPLRPRSTTRRPRCGPASRRRHSQATVPDYALPDQRRWSTYAEYAGIEGVARLQLALRRGCQRVVAPVGCRSPRSTAHPSTSWQSTRFSDEGHWWQVDLSGDVVPRHDRGHAARWSATRRSWSAPTTGRASRSSWPPTTRRASPSVTPSRTTSGSPTCPGAPAPRSTSPRSSWTGSTAARLLALPELPDGCGCPRRDRAPRADATTGPGAPSSTLDVRCVQGRRGRRRGAVGDARVGSRCRRPRRTTPRSMARGVPGRALDALVPAGLVRERHGRRPPASPTRGARPSPPSTATPPRPGRPDLSDVRPTLDLRWLRPQTIDAIAAQRRPGHRRPCPRVARAHAGPAAVARSSSTRTARPRFPPIRTDQLTLEVGDAEPRHQLDFSGATGAVPVGITELRLGGAAGLPCPAQRRRRPSSPCGTGPDRRGQRRAAARRPSPRQPATSSTGEPVPATPVRGRRRARSAPGTTWSASSASDAFAPLSVVLGRGELPPRRARRRSRAPRTASGAPAARPGARPGASWPATRTPTPAGWRRRTATDLDPVVVDGWRQGWRDAGRRRTVDGGLRARTRRTAGRSARGGSPLLALLGRAARGRRRRPGGRAAPWPPSASLPAGRGARPGCRSRVPCWPVSGGLVVGRRSSAAVVALLRRVPRRPWPRAGDGAASSRPSAPTPSGRGAGRRLGRQPGVAALPGGGGRVRAARPGRRRLAATQPALQAQRGHLHHAVEDLRRHQATSPGWSAQMRRPCPVNTLDAGELEGRGQQGQVDAEDAVADVPQVAQGLPRHDRPIGAGHGERRRSARGARRSGRRAGA